MTKTQLL